MSSLTYDELPPIFEALTYDELPPIFDAKMGSNATAPHLFYDSNDENNASLHLFNDTYGGEYGKTDALEIFHSLCGAKYGLNISHHHQYVLSLISLPISTSINDENDPR
eukprot:555492_1